MPAVRLSPRQDPSGTLAQTSATRFLPAASTTASGDSGSQGGSDVGVSVWKYAIVVLLCVFALGALLRLGLIHRLRRQRAAALYSASHSRPHARRQARRESEHSLNGSVYSLDLDGPRTEPPPPAYDQAAGPLPAPTEQQSAPPARRRLFTRLSSLLARGGAPRTDALPMQALPAPSSTGIAQTHATRTADPATLAEIAHLRRALRDAGLLVAPSPRAGARADLTDAQRAALRGASPAVLAAAAERAGVHTADDEDDERRRRRRERRRRRREREAEREREEGLGLPTYSRKVAEGEETLQRAEGWKTDGSDDDSGDSGDDGVLDGVGRESAVVPVLHAQPRASTSSATEGQRDSAAAAGQGRTEGAPTSPACPAPTPGDAQS
ncbi:hypothetical protein JCM3770_000052 [Rhodotorula araucariae]